MLIFRLAEVPTSPSGKFPVVRFVALSDTHRYHGGVDVPRGEVLIYAGDACGNYGRHSDLGRHFEDFLSWLSVQSRRFEHVFFIAGNHETLLDEQQGDCSSGHAQLKRFLKETPNCTYLYNEPCSYRGLRLFGSPVTVSRVETEGKKYYSRGFERKTEERSTLWANLPEKLDLLITHSPPFHHLCSQRNGCQLLAKRLSVMRRPPRFHVFGHDHCFLGVDKDVHTTFLNVAQDEGLRVDPHGGGCALVFDIEVLTANVD